MKLEKYLKDNGISKMEFARRLGVHSSYMYMMTSGTRRPSVDLARKIVKMTNNKVTLEELLPAKKEYEVCPSCGKKTRK